MPEQTKTNTSDDGDNRTKATRSKTGSTKPVEEDCNNIHQLYNKEPTLERRRNISLGERRNTIPIELDFPDDCAAAVGAAYDEQQQQHHHHPVHQSGSRTPASSRVNDDKTNPLHQLPKEARNILAGGIAGIIAKSVVAPVDRIKIMYQITNATFRLIDVPNVARKIIQIDGLAGLWKGNTAAMIRVFPYSGIQFMVFDVCKQYFIEKRHGHHHHHQQQQHLADRTTSTPTDTEGHHARPSHKSGLLPIESLISGMIAGSISVLCTYPLDLTRAQLAVLKKTSHRQTFVTVFWENYHLRGFTGLFRGITPTLIGILPYSGIAFALNEQGKRQIQHWANREATTIERMQCGALAGLVAQTVTYPIEVTRRRMQTVGLVGIHNDSALTAVGCTAEKLKTPRTLLQTVHHLFQEQGLHGFLKGVSMNWIKGPIAFSISFTTYDSVQMIMETPVERSRRLAQLHR